jgi:hypothetical protein
MVLGALVFLALSFHALFCEWRFHIPIFDPNSPDEMILRLVRWPAGYWGLWSDGVGSNAGIILGIILPIMLISAAVFLLLGWLERCEPKPNESLASRLWRLYWHGRASANNSERTEDLACGADTHRATKDDANVSSTP